MSTFVGLRGSVALALVMISGVLTACAAPTRAQRAQEAIYEANMGLRFGAVSGTSQFVPPKEKKKFIEQYGAWHKDLRIVDLDIVAMNLRSDDCFDVVVAVQWQRSTDADIHTTTITQKWGNPKGAWALLSSERVQGDIGLLADAPKPDDATLPAASSQPGPSWASRYQTTIIRE